WLDVAVDYGFLMGIAKSMANLYAHGEFLNQRHRSLFSDDLVESLTIQKLHYQVWRSIQIAKFVDGHNVGMLQCAGGLRFAVETLQEIGVLRIGPGDHFDGDLSPNGGVDRLVDYTHPSATQDVEHVVLADLF